MDKKKVLDYHKGGKIGTKILVPVRGKEDLSLAYTPGVAIPCLEIGKNPLAVYDYTNKKNSVAVVTNGSAVLGLGNIGALASKPVMEGKALLFKHFADVNAVDVLIDSGDINKIVETVKLISPTYGGINLEDIKAPECFEIEKRLKEVLNIPVFHDDQHGTAIVVGSGLLNALKVANKKIEDVKVVINGAGAAGIAVGKMFLLLGVRKENLVMCDSRGVIYSGREVNGFKKEFIIETSKRNLDEVIVDADVFVGVSKKDVLTSEMLLSMNKNPIVFALANPDPEIGYDLARRTREDIILSTGRSDYPNQVNNVLVFPGVFRGALDVRAKEISEKMKVTAVWALAGLVESPSRDKFIVDLFDKRVVVEVALAVAGAVGGDLDLGEYRKELEKRFSF